MTARGHIILKDVKDRVLLGLWTCRVGVWDCDCLAGLFVYSMSFWHLVTGGGVQGPAGIWIPQLVNKDVLPI